ncbi:hypothetical protein GCM10018793_65600 [Streptomyces sulfonofaciens]|uniref:DUF2993 domain-containing protein n=1 Tax=Streptomyces sulfonofaciens TaxID=68272 RepID=A0A919GNM1_9ACTN|nr:DUF2993 domain-containing protein [Streptomyces sulfonofaciens]GHH87923.1 hypothetical protein GCM10018793_65600 [Streptomyces sulfonofaciens]
MRALRILLILVVVLGGLFVAADRVAVGFAEGKAADELRSNENLSEKPEVSIEGFPFLTQVVGGQLDDVEIKIKEYEASAGGATGGGAGTLRIQDLDARMQGVRFSNGYTSATADSATGTAHVSYAELLRAAQVEPVEVAPGATAKVIRLSDGGNGKMKVTVEATVLGRKLPDPITVTSSMRVEGDVVKVHADNLPSFGGVPTPESTVRQITDFQQSITGLPAGIKIDKVEPAPDGVHITVAGSHVSLVG